VCVCAHFLPQDRGVGGAIQTHVLLLGVLRLWLLLLPLLVLWALLVLILNRG